MKPESSLAELRAEIARNTKEIVRMVGRRNRLAQQVGRLKSEASLPAEDEAVEDALLNEVVSECDRVGVSRAAGLKILRVLLEQSKKTQGLGRASSSMDSFSKALALQRQGAKVIRLDVGEPDFRPPRRVLRGCAEALYGFKTHYTEPKGIPALTEALRRYVAKKQRFEAGPDELMVTPSGRFAVYAALATTVEEGDSAVVIEPSWPAYKDILASLHASPIRVHTELDAAWTPSLEDVKAAIRANTKALILNYPNNPTGKVISPRLSRDILELADDRDLTVISDETYNEYSYTPCLSILDRPPKKFVLTASFSKTWAMTGFRVGYAISSKETIASLAKIASLTVTSVPEFIQYGALRALEADSDVRRNVRAMKERIDAVAKALDQIDSIEYFKPDGAMYFFPALKDYEGTGDSFADELLGKGVSVTPGSSFGDYPKFFRISLGQPKEVLLEGVERIGEALA